MIKKSVTIEEVVDYLNDLLKTDHKAIQAMFNERFRVSKALANHPTMQVISYREVYFSAGIIGLLNGMFGVDDNGDGSLAVCYRVTCPNGHDLPGEVEEGNICPECGATTVAREIIGFVAR